MNQSAALAIPQMADFAERDHVIAHLRELRMAIKTASAQDLVGATIFVAAVEAAAKAKAAADVAREATETRARVEYRLAQLLSRDESLFEQITLPPHVGVLPLSRLGRAPEYVHEKVLREMLDSELSCSAGAVATKCQIASLQRAEADIFVSYDGDHFTRVSANRWRRHGSIEAARRVAGLAEDPKLGRLDDAYTKARRYAQTLSKLSRSFSGQQRKIIERAELRQAEVAELLDQALKEN